MSRIGKNPVTVPEGVTVDVSGQDVKVKGPKGELAMRIHDEVSIKQDNGVLRFAPRTNSRLSRTLYPSMRTLANNLVVGVTEGYTKKLKIQGVGYRANLQGQTLVMQLGYSHEVKYTVPEGIQVNVENQTEITIIGIDKQQVGHVAAKIRGFRTPEPYKGKGIRYADEYVQRKEGKKK